MNPGDIVYARDKTHQNYQKWSKGIYVVALHRSGCAHWVEYINPKTGKPMGVVGLFPEVRKDPPPKEEMGREYL